MLLLPESLLLLRLDAERLRNVGDLGALLLDRGGEFGRPAGIDHLRRGVASLAAISGSAATALTSAPIFSRSSLGMLRGPNSPTRPSTSSEGKPASMAVGMSGRIGARLTAVHRQCLDAAGLRLRLQDRVRRHVDLQAAFAHVGGGLHDVPVGHLLQVRPAVFTK